MNNLLKFGTGNAKLGKTTVIMDLPAGHSCPFAKDCNEKVNRKTGKLIVNPDAKFRCFAAVSELISKPAREKRWYNFELLQACENEQEMAALIIASINSEKATKDAPLIRVHSSGDFYNETYFKAWLLVAKAFPEKTLYAYTKSLKYWVNNLDAIPENFHITASRGGHSDDLIDLHNLKNVVIVFSEEEAKEKNLTIDHDDSCVYNKDIHKFALLIHGMQAKGSDAMQAVMTLRKKGITGYHKGKSRKTA